MLRIIAYPLCGIVGLKPRASFPHIIVEMNKPREDKSYERIRVGHKGSAQAELPT